MPKFSRKSITLTAVIAVLAFAVFGYVYVLMTNKKSQDAPKVELTYWGVFDSPEVIQPLIDKYQTLHPNVTIRYEQKEVGKENPVVAYEQDLRNAFAAEKAPDIFQLQNMMIPKYQSLITPLPESDTKLVDSYFDVLAQDALIDNKLYGLPYSIDSLALYYNKRLLSNAGIPNPPRTWDEFDDAVEKLTKIDSNGQFIQSGAALGGSNSNINRATDIVSLFMLQEGTTITDKAHDLVVWNDPFTNPKGERVEHPGLTGLQKYLRYSNPVEGVYTWNNAQNYSFDAFAQEKVGMIISYAYALPIIRGNNPKMQLGIAPLPQEKNVNQKITLASYWLETVSAESVHSEAAWDFLKFATNKENVKLYSSSTNKPVSRHDLVGEELNDKDLGSFAEQNLYATSWYQYDGPKVEETFSEMLNSILKGQSNTITAFQSAGTKIQQILSDGAEIRKKIKEQEAKDAANALIQQQTQTTQ